MTSRHDPIYAAATMVKTALLVVAVLAACAGAAAYVSYRLAMRQAEAAFAAIAGQARPAAQRFDDTLIDGLPEIARRYFRHAIAPGTPLSTTVQLEMSGTFRLGSKAKHTSYPMTARQVLAPPGAFVWIAAMGAGLMRIDGSDGLFDGRVWTRFWVDGLLPAASLRDTSDLMRSGLARPAMEAIWAPASLLPAHGVVWTQTGPDTARLAFPTGVEPVDITLDADGRVTEVVTMRWSDANPEHIFRLQPFGGTMTAERRFGGFTIPVAVSIGNHYGTPDYLPFFEAEITGARFL